MYTEFSTIIFANCPRRNMISNTFLCTAAVLLALTKTVNSAEQSFGSCTTPHGDSSTCIPLPECALLHQMAHPPMSERKKEFLQQSQCGMYKGTVLVCCSDRNITEVTLPEPGVCGSTDSPRIYGGNVTKIDEFPWMAQIEYEKFDESVGHHCGGSLISDRYVLTAAHCIQCIPESWSPVRVRLGEWDTTTDPDCQEDLRGNRNCADPYVEVSIAKVTVHKDYELESKNQFYDIALIRLSRSVAFTNFIAPICLPVKESLKRNTFEGVLMDIVGWGKTEKGFLRSEKKLKAEVPIVPLEDCQRAYRSERLGVMGKKDLKNSQICAGGKLGVDSCGGDSGGPLVGLDSSDKTKVYFFIAGVTSYGTIPCGMFGWPGVYTKVSEYVDWIQQHMFA